MDWLKKCDLPELLEAIKSSKDRDAAFSELVARYNPLLRSRVAAYCINDPCDSEAIQEATVALHSAALTYDPERCDGVTFGLYASVCISNRLKSLIRKYAKENAATETLSEREKISSGHDLESYIVTKDLCDRVMCAAESQLSAYEFEVFRMSFEQYSTKEIAKRLGRTSKSVDNAKNRIYRNLRENRVICEILSKI